MKRILLCCAASVALYVSVFGFLADRPLSLGLLRLEITQKAARLAALPSPKLVILAGSNGPYSHSCAVIGAMLAMPCENAGIAVGIGLDQLFLRYAPDLHAGDVVYLPMELEQYTATRAEVRGGADAGMLLRRDKTLLTRLAPDRVLGAIFCCTLADLLESAAEMPIAAAGLIRPRDMLARQYDAQGDRIGTTLATADAALLRQKVAPAPDPAAITQGYGAALIGQFVAAQEARGVIMIGGLPTQFADIILPGATINAVQQVYVQAGGLFLPLPNNSQYPRADFYDSKDHLAQPCQVLHSIAVARALAAALQKPSQPPTADDLTSANQCPGDVR